MSWLKLMHEAPCSAWPRKNKKQNLWRKPWVKNQINEIEDFKINHLSYCYCPMLCHEHLAALPLWMFICRCSSASMQWPLMKVVASSPASGISTATWTKQCVFELLATFSICCDWSPVLHVTARFRWLLAKVSQHITSQTKHRPCFQRHQRLFHRDSSQSDQRPRGCMVSSLDGISAVVRDLSIRSLSALCWIIRPADLRLAESVEYWMTQQLLYTCKCEEPQIPNATKSSCEWQFWVIALSSRVPIEEHGSAFRNASEYGRVAGATVRRAIPAWFVRQTTLYCVR